MNEWQLEKEYIKNNPGKHKFNRIISPTNFFQLESVGRTSQNLNGDTVFTGNKVADTDLLECIDVIESDSLILDESHTESYFDVMGEKWLARKILNVNYVKDNAIITMFVDESGSSYGVISAYIDKSGSWMGYISKSTDVEGLTAPHKIDNGLMHGLPSMFEEGSSVVDFGCGNADYIKHLIENGFECEAYDGNPDTPEMTGGIGKVLDLSKKFDLGKTFDYVMSLEVAEHIPKEFEETYVDNLIRHTGFYLITSWAVKGQGGDGHVNEQDEDYVLNLYKEKGMVYNKEISEALRGVAKLGWFKNTIFVFKKK